MKKIAIYPGSFDPPTNGHIDIVKRGLTIFDKIIVAVLINPSKKSLFTTQERMDMIRESLAQFSTNIEVESFNGLLVDFASIKNAGAILRGMRAISDFEYEFQLALMNRKLNREIQSVFLVTGLRWSFISSSIVKEAASFGADISDMVPSAVYKKLKEKYDLKS
jgi:pantetheine-phosphate adenylyltransferase